MRTLATLATAGVLALASLGARAQQAEDYRIRVVDPGEESTVFSDVGDVPVRVSVEPGLSNGDQVELLVDGLPPAPPAARLEFHLAGVAPGTHRLQARIIDSTGNVGSISPSFDIHVWHASRLFPARRDIR